MGALIEVLLVLVAGALGLALAIFVVIKVIGLLARAFGHVGRFVGGVVGDTFRGIGALLTGALYAVLSVGSLVIGRWSAATHYGQGLKGECRNALLAAYRVVIGHPARFLFMGGLVEGLEQRLPAMVAAAPTSDGPSRRAGGLFEGYTVVGSLPAGGSGGKLYIAEPDEIKRASFAREGVEDVSRVVIKSFSLGDGSTLPQIVRESRSLDAAKRMGLILDHELSPERFYYVMRYVPGQNLTVVTKQLHGMSGEGGLDAARLGVALGYAADLLGTLERYHRGGLWHKDVKPDNIIVDSRMAHLVDFGLVTPLRSAMTLTTHGTEYFRDPELVRQALKGVKVHEVDGTRFDIYAAGAVLYSMIEDSFPAHGVLSPITKRCPEALRWIVRRAMTDYDKRYATAGEMLADVEAVRQSGDVFAMRPVDLPSVRGSEGEEPVAVGAGAERLERMFGVGTPPPIPAGAPGGVVERGSPAVRRPAVEQLSRARARAAAARERAATRGRVRVTWELGEAAAELRRARRRERPYSNGVSGPIVGAIAATAGIAVSAWLVVGTVRNVSAPRVSLNPPTPPAPPVVAVASGTPLEQARSILEARVSARESENVALPGSRIDGPVVFFSDVGTNATSALKEQVSAAMERLREAGARIISNVGPVSGDESAVLSEVTYAMAGVPVDGSDAGRRMGEWIGKRQGDPAAVVWVSAHESGMPQYYVFADGAMERSLRVAERVRDVLGRSGK